MALAEAWGEKIQLWLDSQYKSPREERAREEKARAEVLDQGGPSLRVLNRVDAGACWGSASGPKAASRAQALARAVQTELQGAIGGPSEW